MTFRILLFCLLSTNSFGQVNYSHIKDDKDTLTLLCDKSAKSFVFEGYKVFPMDNSKTGLPSDYVTRIAGESSISGIFTSLSQLRKKNMYQIHDIIKYTGSEIYIDLTNKYQSNGRFRTTIIWLRPKN